MPFPNCVRSTHNGKRQRAVAVRRCRTERHCGEVRGHLHVDGKVFECQVGIGVVIDADAVFGGRARYGHGRAAEDVERSAEIVVLVVDLRNRIASVCRAHDGEVADGCRFGHGGSNTQRADGAGSRKQQSSQTCCKLCSGHVEQPLRFLLQMERVYRCAAGRTLAEKPGFRPFFKASNIFPRRRA